MSNGLIWLRCLHYCLYTFSLFIYIEIYSNTITYEIYVTSVSKYNEFGHEFHSPKQYSYYTGVMILETTNHVGIFPAVKCHVCLQILDQRSNRQNFVVTRMKMLWNQVRHVKISFWDTMATTILITSLLDLTSLARYKYIVLTRFQPHRN